MYRLSAYKYKDYYLVKLQNKRPGETAKDLTLCCKQEIDVNLEKYITRRMCHDLEIKRKDKTTLEMTTSRDLVEYLPDHYTKLSVVQTDPLYQMKMKLYRSQLEVYHINNTVNTC